ncbi:MAG: hypothetical protein ACFFBF_01395, partial [Promethearchaeota archaeon]
RRQDLPEFPGKLLLDVGKKKSMYFHLIASFRHLSTFIFLPLGTLLSNFVTTEYLIIIGAILLNLSLIPLIYIKL